MRTKRKTTHKNKTQKQNKIKTADYIVAIPTYNRSDVLAQKTLATLRDGSVPPSKIHLFVANQTENDKYAAAIPRELYGKIIIGRLGITAQRRFIVDYFPEGQQIVSLDDDVEGVFKRKTETKLARIRNLDTFFKSAFAQLRERGLFLWGVYPTANPFYMRGRETTNLKFIIGGLFGFINRPMDRDLRLSGHADQKEDIEQSILYYIKDGGVLRYNQIGFKTKFHAPGGLGQTKDRLEANEAAAKYLAEKYPQYATAWKRPNGMYEIRLRDKTK